MRSSSSSAAARHAPSRRNSPFRSVSERAEIGHRPGSAVRCAGVRRQLPGGGGGLSAQDVPGTVGEREKVRQRLFGTNVRPAQRGIPKGTAPTAGNPSAAEAYPHRMSPELSGSGRRSGSGCLGRMCALRSAAFRKERRRLREIPPRRTPIRTGCPRNLPESGRRSGSGGRRRVRKTAGSRKIDENLIFGTRAFVFYPLSLAAPKILRLNKIANKFAFVSGLFVSLRLKPKYANRP